MALLQTCSVQVRHASFVTRKLYHFGPQSDEVFHASSCPLKLHHFNLNLSKLLKIMSRIALTECTKKSVKLIKINNIGLKFYNILEEILYKIHNF